MKFEIIGLDDKTYLWYPLASASKNFKRSKLQEKAVKLIEEFYPYDTILEELTLPGSKDGFRHKPLRADIFLPQRKIMIEVHGQQHFKYNIHFHRSKLEFYRARARDLDKKNWCDINDIRLVELNHNETIDEWRTKIS